MFYGMLSTCVHISIMLIRRVVSAVNPYKAFPSTNGTRIILPNIVSLTQSMMLKKEVQLANYRIGALPTVSRLIAKEVDLTWEGLTVNTKDGTLSGCEEENWARLQRITWVVHLQGKKVSIHITVGFLSPLGATYLKPITYYYNVSVLLFYALIFSI